MDQNVSFQKRDSCHFAPLSLRVLAYEFLMFGLVMLPYMTERFSTASADRKLVWSM